jgi:hypothetical protein
MRCSYFKKTNVQKTNKTTQNLRLNKKKQPKHLFQVQTTKALKSKTKKC